MTPPPVRCLPRAPYPSMRWMVLVPALAIIPWFPLLCTGAADQLAEAGTPTQEGTSAFPGAEPPVRHAASGAGGRLAAVAWVDDMRNSLGIYMWNHPAAQLNPYLETLTLVRDAVGRGDRRTVKLEMDTYFTMLAVRAQGISEAEAKDLSAVALQVTPAEAYGIVIPRSLRR